MAFIAWVFMIALGAFSVTAIGNTDNQIIEALAIVYVSFACGMMAGDFAMFVYGKD